MKAKPRANRSKGFDGSIEEDERRRPGFWTLLREVPHVVGKVGFRGLTYRRLASDAGVTYGLISYYFGSRDSLIEKAAYLASEEAIERSRLVATSSEIDDFAAGLSKLLAEEPDAQAFQYELACEARRSPSLQPSVKRMYDRYVAVVSSSLDELGVAHDEALARVVFAALDGLVLQQLVYGDGKLTDESVVALRRVLAALPKQKKSDRSKRAVTTGE
ncbi:MAG: TetR family transcriptional regulator [Actinobacteria bacterium]|nr:TetR family transcriptional regulator [Actinomycetota bacterium]